MYMEKHIVTPQLQSMQSYNPSVNESTASETFAMVNQYYQYSKTRLIRTRIQQILGYSEVLGFFLSPW